MTNGKPVTVTEATELVCDAAERYGSFIDIEDASNDLAEAIDLLRSRLPWAWQR